MRAAVTAFSVAALSLFAGAAGPGVAFSARDGRLVLAAPGYRLTLSATNGRVIALADTAGTRLLEGSYGCLWGVNPNHHASRLGGCSFTPSGPRRFSYRWDARAATLTLTYRAAALGSAVVTVHAGATSFDLRLVLANRGPVRDEVRFPDGLAGDTGTVAAGYVPEVLPGVRLKPAFFSRIDNTVQIYPSRWAFADYLALDVGRGHVALYSVNKGPIAPLQLGFLHLAPRAPCSRRVYCVIHEFETWIETGATWTSPIVRVRVGDTAQQSILAYRSENGIGAYPSLAAKLGSRLGTFARAPLLKADVPRLEPFATWGPALRALPSPVLVHPVAYQTGGHDNGDPDFLPPDPRWGTTADFAAMIAQAHARGDVVMPYANVSWWDPTSPTMQSPQAKNVAVLDQNGKEETVAYGAHVGVVVSPYAPYVKQRVAQEVAQLTSDLPSDCVFFDQLGARPWLRDFNAASPSPLAYDDGWIALLAPYAGRCLMVEDGWDRLARDFVGFNGGLLMMERELGLPDTFFGAGDWEPYPLADWLFHDKVLMYEHDLYPGTMATDGEVLAWNMAFGLVGSFEWKLGDENDPWLALVARLQEDLGPHYAGVPLKSYAQLAPGVTRSVFGDLTVAANLSTQTYDGIAADAFRASTADGSIVAGGYAGGAFSPGVHWLIEERDASGVTVRQPVGGDTPVTVRASGTTATALAADGTVLGTVPAASTGGSVAFEYAGTLGGRPVAAYRLAG
ncbi:MAG: DUF6259 domain-containing protein [Gaiellaceae bacterium]